MSLFTFENTDPWVVGFVFFLIVVVCWIYISD